MRLILVAAFLFAQEDASKEMMKGWKHEWEGATQGTWIKIRHSSFKQVKDSGGEMAWEEGKKTDTVWTVSKVDKDFLTLTREVNKRKVDSQHYLGPSSGYVGTVTKAGEEELKVGQKTFKCTIYELKKEPGKNRVQLTRVWKSPDAPFWAVKNSWSDTGGGKPLGHVEELIGIDEVVKVGDKEYKCQVLRKTTEGLGTKTVQTTWWCDDLPGRMAKRTSETYMGDKLVGKGAEELAEFEKK